MAKIGQIHYWPVVGGRVFTLVGVTDDGGDGGQDGQRGRLRGQRDPLIGFGVVTAVLWGLVACQGCVTPYAIHP
ncbi:hypothetical protein [Acrocarpospora sp. B8E8]|uniref:hypothetical protein n=1 Tax=Acrocarpospora sp. B8E8 TaxID=3153572 RepID=UPI00325C7FDD